MRRIPPSRTSSPASLSKRPRQKTGRNRACSRSCRCQPNGGPAASRVSRAALDFVKSGRIQQAAQHRTPLHKERLKIYPWATPASSSQGRRLQTSAESEQSETYASALESLTSPLREWPQNARLYPKRTNRAFATALVPAAATAAVGGQIREACGRDEFSSAGGKKLDCRAGEARRRRGSCARCTDRTAAEEDQSTVSTEQKVPALPRNASKRKPCPKPGSFVLDEGYRKVQILQPARSAGDDLPGATHVAGIRAARYQSELFTQHALAGIAKICKKSYILLGCLEEASYRLPRGSVAEGGLPSIREPAWGGPLIFTTLSPTSTTLALLGRCRRVGSPVCWKGVIVVIEEDHGRGDKSGWRLPRRLHSSDRRCTGISGVSPAEPNSIDHSLATHDSENALPHPYTAGVGRLGLEPCSSECEDVVASSCLRRFVVCRQGTVWKEAAVMCEYAMQPNRI